MIRYRTMRRPLLAATLAAAALLGGCAHHGPHGDGPKPCQRCDAQAPKTVAVSVSGKEIKLGTEILLFKTNQGPYTITWTLDDQTASKFEFDRDAGIRIDGLVLDEFADQSRSSVKLQPKQDQIGTCQSQRVGEVVRTVTCVNRATRTGVFKYTIRLRDRSGALIERDPPIVNW